MFSRLLPDFDCLEFASILSRLSSNLFGYLRHGVTSHLSLIIE